MNLRLLEKFGPLKLSLLISTAVTLMSLILALVINKLIQRQITYQTFIVATTVPFFVSLPFIYIQVRLAEKLRIANKVREEDEKKFELLFDSANDGIFILDMKGNFIDFNKTAHERLGYKREEMIVMHITQINDPQFNPMVPERLGQIKEHGKAVFESAHMRKDGSVMPVEVSSRLLFLGGQEVYFSVIRDITERKKLEEELLKVQKLESTGILAGGIAHDFNNILTGIMGNISMAKMSVKTDNKVYERLESAEKASLRAQNLTHQLLTFSKGGAPIKQTASIKSLIIDTASFILSGANVKHEVSIEENLWAASIDEGQISQVIQNLIKNAEQAMPDGGVVTVHAKNIKISQHDTLPLKEGRYVQITIKDQGGGILAKHIPKVFDPYFTTKQEGSGLGLAVSYSIIKNHDGFITAESEYGNGATFHVYLPASEKTLPGKAEVINKTYKSGEKILIMDDNQNVRDVAANMLNMMGYQTEIAKDGSEAIALYDEAQKRGAPFDAVLLDLTVPGGMGGKETLQELSNINPKVKAIVSSGYANDPIMANYEEYGFHGVVSKPYNMEKMGEALSKIFT